MNRAMAEHVGLHTRLKAGTETAYDAAHAAVWPELLEAIRAAGFTRWLIFRDGLEVFHAIECEIMEAIQAAAPGGTDLRSGRSGSNDL
jgi:L-rhamnose mutarotase